MVKIASERDSARCLEFSREVTLIELDLIVPLPLCKEDVQLQYGKTKGAA